MTEKEFLTVRALIAQFENIVEDFIEYEWSEYDNFEMNEKEARVILDALKSKLASVCSRDDYPKWMHQVLINNGEKWIPVADLFDSYNSVHHKVLPHKAHWTTKRTEYHDGEYYCSACEYEPDLKDGSLPDRCPNCHATMSEKYTVDKYDELIESLQMLEFFNQRAGRELWQEKPANIQDADIRNAETILKSAIDAISCLQAINHKVSEPSRDYKDLIFSLRNNWSGNREAAADAIEHLIEERDAAISDLTMLVEDPNAPVEMTCSRWNEYGPGCCSHYGKQCKYAWSGLRNVQA